MKATALIQRFRPGEIIQGEWVMSGFRQCIDPGNFYLTMLKVVAGVEGHPDKVTFEPLDLWYRNDMGEETCVWRMPAGESAVRCDAGRRSELLKDKEEKVYDAIRSREPPYGLPLERELDFFFGMFTANYLMFMDERFALSGIMKGHKNAVQVIKDKYSFSRDELRQMTRAAFQDNQPRGKADFSEFKVAKITYRLHSN
jgi:hypothetical protein